MADNPAPSSAERIESALQRIEAATKQLSIATVTLDRRHRALRDSMTSAVAVIDGVLAESRSI